MSLSGNLSFVALDEVLRLLSRSNQQGAVDVRGDGVRGRIYMGKRGIDLATTFDDDELRRHILNSGVADDGRIRAIESGSESLASPDDDAEVVELIREMTVESLYRLSDHGTYFEVYEHRGTPFASPRPFELEEVLAAARRRADDWKTVRRTVPDLGMTVEFNRDLGDRAEVRLAADDWKVLSEIRAGASVAQIADRLGTTDFWTARVVSDLVAKDLIKLINGGTRHDDTDAQAMAPAWRDDEPVSEEDESYTDPYDTPANVYQAEEPKDSHEDAGASADDEEAAVASRHNQSWWQDPEADDAAEASDVEEDTEAFLEKVFSELEEGDEEHEGHGLLRRRRLGALRDLTGES